MAGESSTSTKDLRDWLEESAKTSPDRRLIVDLAGALRERDVLSVVDRAWSAGFDDVSAKGDPALVSRVAEHARVARPIVVFARADPEGERIDPRTQGPWNGVGRYVHGSSRRIVFEVEGEDFTDPDSLAEQLGDLRVQRPEARLVLALGLGVGPLDVMWFKGIPERLGFPNLGLRAADPTDAMWRLADQTPIILDIDYDGRITVDEEVLLEPKEARESDDPYEGVTRWHREMAPRLPTGGSSVKFRTLPHLLRVHPSASFVHVQRLIAIAGSSAVKMPRVEVAIAGRPLSEYQAIWIPVPSGSEPEIPEEHARVAIDVVRRGRALAPGSTRPAQRGEAFVWSEDRTLAFEVVSDDAVGVLEWAPLLGYIERTKPKWLVIDAGEGVTFGEVMPLIRSARLVGVTQFGFASAKTEPQDDFR